MLLNYAMAAARISRHILRGPQIAQTNFEMAYQVRVAVEKIRFAIKQIESSKQNAEPIDEALLQLLDALDRLQSAELNVQSSFRKNADANRFLKL